MYLYDTFYFIANVSLDILFKAYISHFLENHIQTSEAEMNLFYSLLYFEASDVEWVNSQN